MDLLERFLNFAEQSPTAFHAAENLSGMLRENGFAELKETDPWLVDAGGKYFVRRNDSAVIAFIVPETGFGTFRIAAAHSDSPAFKLKERFEDKTEYYVRLNVEKYGGMIMSTWLDRPLSVAGRLAVRDGGGVATKLVNLDRDALLIPNMPIHFNRDINDGYKFDPQVDMLPIYGGAESSGGLMREIAEDAYFSCGRIDDLECAWACMTALVHSGARDTVNVCAVFDNEEVGSGSRQGADSGFLYDTLTRLGFALGASDGEIRAAMAGSFLVSADNAHAVHPNHPEKFDKQNRPVMNGGVVIKHNANLKYTTDALSSARFALICEKAGVPVQHFANRSDIAGGSTLGHISTAHVSVESVDIGLAQLAMHSLYETAGTKDLPMLISAMEEMWR